MAARTYRFSFGPWNISQGADPFGPPVRKEVAFAAKIGEYKKLGFDGVQFHDDDVVPPDLIDSDHATVMKAAHWAARLSISLRVMSVHENEVEFVQECPLNIGKPLLVVRCLSLRER